MNLFLDLRIPGVTSAQFGPVEPHLDARRLQGFADAPGRLCILGAIGNEDSAFGVRLFWHQGFSVPVRGIGVCQSRCRVDCDESTLRCAPISKANLLLITPIPRTGTEALTG